MKPLIAVIYDGIGNSVFTSQVIEPLRKKNEQDILIVSFENNPTKAQEISLDLPSHISLIILKKIPFIGQISVRFAAYQLKKILKQYDEYIIQARGPLAGWICMYALDAKKCEKLLVQARGLLAEEYTYAHSSAKGIKKWLHRLRAYQLYLIEKKVFGFKSPPFSYEIEAVSPALKEYVIKTFNASSEQISIAKGDIPSPLSRQQKQTYRTAVRKDLHISEHTTIYCYNGSAKPWQCPELVIEFFKEKLKNNNDAFLLLITQDKDIFEQLCIQEQLNKNQYRILSVKHEEVFIYLAACDTGLLFRKKHVINWVSRPTKMLEYQTAGLAIQHNNTIEWLTKK